MTITSVKTISAMMISMMCNNSKHDDNKNNDYEHDDNKNNNNKHDNGKRGND